ncbi:short-chain collagen C4-like [Lingula anatina]|uniref:Short-chain collagen C4-like n=1 Tax=Lingula anatina TaxID=7574 RepID=A0A1S3KFA1_LINAN|nr:short-chain collagen C4-like [Lingula anatina]|eukprot:XP_013421313.1 short-chain collagen C4-like [Lingula anatina]
MKLHILSVFYICALILLLSYKAQAHRYIIDDEEEEGGEISLTNDKEVTKMLKELKKYRSQDKQQKQINQLKQLARELQKQVVILHNKLHECSNEEKERTEQEDTSANKTSIRHKRSIQNSAGTTGGATYIRWGRSTCPQGVELVYNGVGAGSHYTHSGGGSDYLCVPHDPEWGVTTDGFQSNSFLYGVEFEIQANNPFLTHNTPKLTTVHDQSPRCAVCRIPSRSSQVMIPAKMTCPASWTKEYDGYLMSSHHTQKKSQFVCVDKAPEVMDGGDGDQNGALFYIVEAQCGSLPCPSYLSGKEITCVVCSK